MIRLEGLDTYGQYIQYCSYRNYDGNAGDTWPSYTLIYYNHLFSELRQFGANPTERDANVSEYPT